jgi:hypothetical protein
MMSQQTGSPAALRNALYELALAKQVPNAEVLDEFVRRYPEHAAELTDFAIELALDAAAATADAQTEPARIGDSVAVSKAMSRFHNRLYAVQREASPQSKQPGAVVDNPFVTLDRAGIRDVGQRLNANNVFVMKLRDRQIDAGTMTAEFQRRVAEALKVSIDVIVTHFNGPTQMIPGVHFKADEKPGVGGKQTFEEAVRSSGLTPEQETYLLNL